MTKKVLADPEIMDEDKIMSKVFLGSLDTALFLSYSVTQFFTGTIGDSFDKRYVIAIAYFIQAIGYILLSMAAHYQIYNEAYWYICFIIIGIS